MTTSETPTPEFLVALIARFSALCESRVERFPARVTREAKEGVQRFGNDFCVFFISTRCVCVNSIVETIYAKEKPNICERKGVEDQYSILVERPATIHCLVLNFQ
jgi:hypothetical protein